MPEKSMDINMQEEVKQFLNFTEMEFQSAVRTWNVIDQHRAFDDSDDLDYIYSDLHSDLSLCANVKYQEEAIYQWMPNIHQFLLGNEKEDVPLSVLDYGCGCAATTLKTVIESEVNCILSTVDYSKANNDFIIHMFDKYNLSGVIHTPESFWYKDFEYYDLVMCTNVLEHVPNPYEIYENLKNSMKKDGVLILFVPYGPGPGHLLDSIEEFKNKVVPDLKENFTNLGNYVWIKK